MGASHRGFTCDLKFRTSSDRTQRPFIGYFETSSRSMSRRARTVAGSSCDTT